MDQKIAVQAALIQQLFSTNTRALVTSTSLAAILAYIQLDVIDHSVVFVWFSLIVLLALFRIALIIAYRRSVANAKAATHTWLMRIRLGVLFTGVAWGLSSILLFPADHPQYQIFLVCMLVGLTAGGLVSYATDLVSAIIFNVSVLVPLIIRLSVTENSIDVAMSAALILYLGFFIMSLRYINRNVRENISLRLEADAREKAVRLSEQRYRLLLNHSPVGIIHYNTDFVITYCNDRFADMLCSSAKNLTGLDMKTLNDQSIMPAMKKALEGQVGHYEGQYVATFSNVTGWVSMICASSRDDAGKIMGGVAIIQDIAGRKQAEAELNFAKERAEAATRLKDQFVALISHDLRSPLISIKGMLDIAKEESPEGLLEMSKNRTFDRMAKSAEGLITLTERLLDHSRLQTGDIKPEKRFINVRSLAEDQINRISHLAFVKNITLRNTLPETMHIYADPDLYGEVIHNVLSNAIKFTHQGGEITVFSTDESSVIVRDNGIGIDEKMLPDLFNMDVKITTYGTNGEKGTGLGLPYSYNIMKAHGGNLMAVPMKDKGTEFHIILPKHTSVVLVVDDQDIQRVIMKEMIASLNRVQVVEARNGAEALDMLHYIMPSIIITDIQMPVMDGFELVRRIRSLPQYEMVPIMTVTAFAGSDSAELREKLSTLGADDIIAKPLVEDEFLPVLARYLGNA